MPPVHLWLDAMSQPSRAVHLLLLETGIPHVLETRSIGKGEHKRDEELKKCNPNQTMPAIRDGEGEKAVRLFESHTILAYLVSKYPEYAADHWYPRDVTHRAVIQQYLDWHHSTLRRGASGLVFVMMLAPLLKPNMTEAQKEAGRVEFGGILKQALKRIETSFLPNENGYLMGRDDISIADLSASEEIIMLDLVGYDYRTPYPKLSAWLDRVKERTNRKGNWDKVNAVVMKVATNAKAKREALAVVKKQAQTNKTAASSSAASSSVAAAAAMQITSKL